jgi:hypothetical protein
MSASRPRADAVLRSSLSGRVGAAGPPEHGGGRGPAGMPECGVPGITGTASTRRPATPRGSFQRRSGGREWAGVNTRVAGRRSLRVRTVEGGVSQPGRPGGEGWVSAPMEARVGGVLAAVVGAARRPARPCFVRAVRRWRDGRGRGPRSGPRPAPVSAADEEGGPRGPGVRPSPGRGSLTRSSWAPVLRSSCTWWRGSAPAAGGPGGGSWLARGGEGAPGRAAGGASRPASSTCVWVGRATGRARRLVGEPRRRRRTCR